MVRVRTPRRASRALAALLISTLALAGCGDGGSKEPESHSAHEKSAAPTEAETSGEVSGTSGHSAHGSTEKARPIALREGEKRLTVEMPTSYTPSAPYGKGTDDYRCFLLDPELKNPAWLTGTNVLPGNPNVVHHVILFRVPADQVQRAEDKDASEEGEGWTCFGGTGLDSGQEINNAPWLGAWAPGGRESVMKPGFGTWLEPGTRIVMQVHYNLLMGAEADVSATQLRVAPAERDYKAISTVLMTAPVELPCRPEHADGPLCDRAAAMVDVRERFGDESKTADLLHFLCDSKPTPGPSQSCTRAIGEPVTIHAVAGHMHLLGRSIKVETNPGTPQARTVLDTKVWNFDDQASRPIKPVHLDGTDPVRITCTHDQALRDNLPAFETEREDRYVVWGDGSTDEMCLGMLLVTRG